MTVFLKYVGPEPEVLDPFLGTFTRGIAREIDAEMARVKVQGNSTVWVIVHPSAPDQPAEKTVENKMMDYGKKSGNK